MGLFSKRINESKKEINTNPNVKCHKLLRSPPSHYGKGSHQREVKKEQDSSYDKVLSHFEQESLILPVKNLNGLGLGHNPDVEYQPLSTIEKLWLTKECIMRYLRSANGNDEEAIKMIEDTIIWRREFGLSTSACIAHSPFSQVARNENKTGKMILLGYDSHCRPLLCAKLGEQNSNPSFAQIQHIVYMIESAVSSMPQGVDTLTLLLDFHDSGGTFTRMPPLSLSKQIIRLLQKHYPERLGRAVLSNIPWYGWNFLKLLHPLIDVDTRSKVSYEDSFDNYIDESQLQIEYGGRLDFTYEHDCYWPDLENFTETRGEQTYQNFLNLGGTVGLSEYDLKSITLKS